ncbi:MAG: single-stranded DNA-binding protein [Saprospiraceae bacterium]|nr:single-stranded DNA-binding protein [Saprospiraceae bacterium]
MVNRVILIGNLGKDPEVRRLENGAVVAKFSLATNENYRDKSGEWQQQTEWHDIVAWRALAERAESSLKKGSMVYVEGKLSHRSWQDQDGNNRRTTEVVTNYFRLIPTTGGSSGSTKMGGGYFPDSNDEPNTITTPVPDNNVLKSNENVVTEDADDDLPF